MQRHERWLIVFLLAAIIGKLVSGSFSLLDMQWYAHYKFIGICKIEFGIGNWVGHLFMIEWHQGDWMFDLLYLNPDRHFGG